MTGFLPAIDFRELFIGGHSGSLVFGVTEVSAMPATLERIPNDLGFALLTLVRNDDLELVFDEKGNLGAVNFGFADGDVLAEPVLQALVGKVSNGLTIGGQGINAIVHLADFAAGSAQFGPFEMTGRASDGWLRFTATNTVSSIRFEFLKDPANAPAGAAPDYFLYGISVVSVIYEARLIGLMNS